MTLTIHLSAFATCVTINGTQECVGSPPILTSIKSDRLVYENSDKPVITITGVPYSTVNFEIDNQSGKKVFSHLIEVMPTGLANYTLDISSYKSGLYTAIANASNSVTTIFRIGLVSFGQVNSSSIIATNSSNSIPPIPSSTLHSPVPTLSPSEIQSVVNVALSVPELQKWSHDWQYVHTAFLGNNKVGTAGGFEWQYAMIYLKTPPNSGLIPCDIGWDAEVTVDMTTMKVVSSNYPTMNSQCHGVTITGGGPQNVQPPLSPLKQFKSGIPADKVVCKQGFQLILKKENNSPACIKPKDVVKLVVQREWGLAIN